MDPIGATVMSILMPYVTKKAEKFIQIAGKAAYEKAKNILATLKTRWAGDKEATNQLAYFEQNPERYQPIIEDILEKRLAQDKTLATELKQLIDQMGTSLSIIQEMDEAKNVIGLKAKHVKKAKINIVQKAKKAEDMIGGEFDTIGE